MTNLNILGFLRNLELAERNVSSTNGFLVNHLSETGHVSEIHDIALPNYQDKIYLIKNFAKKRKVWGFKFATDLARKRAMSKRACQMADSIIGLDKHQDINTILQIGSEFSLDGSRLCANIPRFSYHDNNIMAYLKSEHKIEMTSNLKRRVNSVIDYESKIYTKLTGIFTMTEFLRDSFIEDFGVPAKKVHCIGFGSNTSAKEYITKDYSRDVLLFIAKDSFEEKGGQLVLEAFKKIKKTRKDAELYLVGQDLNVDLDGVTVVGFLDKRNKSDYERFVELYRKATLFIMPSYVEAVGNVFIEAMSFQVPCIGAKISAMPEIIERNKCGIVVTPGSVNDLTNAVLTILDDKKRQKTYGDNGYNAVASNYTWANAVSKAQEIMVRYI